MITVSSIDWRAEYIFITFLFFLFITLIGKWEAIYLLLLGVNNTLHYFLLIFFSYVGFG